MSERILTTRQVQQRIPYHRVHLYRLACAGKFPRPVKLSPRRNGWLESEIDAWISDRAVERDAAEDQAGANAEAQSPATKD